MLCLRADVKTELGIAAADTSEDSRIDALIIAASMQIAEELGREPWLQTYLERLPGQGGRYLRLSCWPVQGLPASITLGTGASPTTVDAATYSVAGPWRDRIYRATGWNLSAVDRPKHLPVAGDRPLDYNVTYTAGWVMPDQVTVWTNGGSVASGGWYRSTDLDHPLIFKAGSAGTFDSSEPTWPTVEGGTVTDNSIVYTAHAQRLPESVSEACLVAVLEWASGGLAMPSGVRSERADGWGIEYKESAPVVALPIGSLALVAPWKSWE